MNSVNIVIPLNKEEKIYLNESYSGVVRGFFRLAAVKAVLENMEKFKSDYELSVAYYDIFELWIEHLKTLGFLNKYNSNLLMIEFLPYFLLYCGMDFRKYLDITKHFPEYDAAFSMGKFADKINLENYSIEELGYDS